MIILTASAYTTYAGISFYRNEDGFYKNVVMPAVHLLDPEKAHNLAIFCSKHRLLPKAVYKDPNSLVCLIWLSKLKYTDTISEN